MAIVEEALSMVGVAAEQVFIERFVVPDVAPTVMSERPQTPCGSPRSEIPRISA